MAMQVCHLHDAEAFVTLDGSTIRAYSNDDTVLTGG